MDPMTLLGAERSIDHAMMSARPGAPVVASRPRSVGIRMRAAAAMTATAHGLARLAIRIEPKPTDVCSALGDGS